MKVMIVYNRLIKIESFASNSIIEVPDNCTVRDFLALIKLPAYLKQSVSILVNDEPIWNSTLLKENDVVKLNPLMSGG